MSTKQSILFAFAILSLSSLLLFIIFGESGLADLNILKREKNAIEEKNEAITQENLTKYREIDRLKHDLKYVEKVARDELGMIREGEVIIKPKDADGREGPVGSRQTAVGRRQTTDDRQLQTTDDR
jgi:cell division protein FtsB